VAVWVFTEVTKNVVRTKMLPFVTTITEVVRLGTKLEPHQNLMIISESVSSCKKIYSRAGQLYELLKLHLDSYMSF
jgi:hypothetical protein